MKKKSVGIVLMIWGSLLTSCGMMLLGRLTQYRCYGLSFLVFLIFMAGVSALLTGIVVDAIQRN
jgi:hypothetical protein